MAKRSKLLKKLFGLLPSVLFLLILFVLSSWWYDATSDRRYLQRVYIDVADQYDIIAFGDSLIEGLGARQTRGFIDLLSDRLNVEIHNAGRRGDQTVDGLLRLENDVLRFQPKLVIISLGGNDYLRDRSVVDIFNNLELIIRRIQDSGAEVLLLGIQAGTFRDNFDGQYDRLLTRVDVHYVPNILEGLLFTPRYMFDPIHPNDKGHEHIANKIEPVLVEVLTEMELLPNRENN